MIIKVSGYKDNIDKDTKLLKGITVYGIVTVPDFVDPSLHGNASYEDYFTIANLNGVFPEIGKEYEVKFINMKFKGEYTARPHHLQEV